MIYLIAIALPPLAMFRYGRVMSGLLCIVLMITGLGWPVASVWAVLVTNSTKADRRADQIVRAIRQQGGESPREILERQRRGR